jgi:hypothetical protein
MKARQKLTAGKLAVGYPSSRDEAVLNAGGCRSESVLWDYALDGGAVGDISFGRSLPAGAIVVRVVTDELAAVTGATSITLKAGATSLTGALDLTGSSGTNGQALASSATAIKVASSSELLITIATNAATAGKVRFYVEYLLQNDTAE